MNPRHILRAVMIRERLARYHKRNNPTSVKKTLEEILFSDDTSYSLEMNRPAPGDKKYDYHYELKNDTLTKFINKDTLNISRRHLTEIESFLKSQDSVIRKISPAINADVVDRYPLSNEPPANYDRQAALPNSGQYFLNDRREQNLLKFGFLLIGTNHNIGVSTTFRVEANFSLRGNEHASMLSNRFERGDTDLRHYFLGRIYPTKDGALFMPEIDGRLGIQVSFILFSRDDLTHLKVNNVPNGTEFTYSSHLEEQNLHDSTVNAILGKYAPTLRSALDIKEKSLGYNGRFMETELDIILLEAARNNDIEAMIAAIVEGATLSARSENGFTARHWAAHNCSMDALAALAECPGSSERRIEAIAAVAARLRLNPALIKQRWEEAVRQFDPLQRDSQGYFPSARVSELRLKDRSPEGIARHELWRELMNQEILAAHKRELNYFDEITPLEGQFAFPTLTVD